MKLSDKGREMLILFEGRRDRVYRDVAGKLTGGVGHLFTARDQRAFTEGKQIPPDLIDVWFTEDVETAEARVMEMLQRIGSVFMLGVDIKQTQFDALVSLAFNLGGAPFAANTGLFKAMENSDNEDVAAQIRRWCYATVNGKKTKIPGLVARREAEARLFEEGIYPGQPEPGRPMLPSAATQWPTPSAQTYGTNQGGAAGRVGPIRPSLETLSKAWDYTLPALETCTHGGTCRRVLNPRFVAWLMGMPPGWTEREPIDRRSFEAWETLSARSLRRLLSECSAPDLRPDP